MILLELLLGFLKVGCFSFGGAYAAIPLIRDVVLAYGWLDEEMLSYMIAVSESTPGPIMVNIATYVGSLKAGFIGAAIATFAVVLPAFLIVIIITALLTKVINSKNVQATLEGIKASVIGIIFATGMWMIISNCLDSSSAVIDFKNTIFTVILATVYYGYKKISKKNMSPITLICISAVVGIVG